MVGRNGVSVSSPGGTIKNSYCIKNTTYSYYYWNGSVWGNTSYDGMIDAEALKTYASQLGEAYTNDVKNEDGTWKYNDGYPILKWQLNVK